MKIPLTQGKFAEVDEEDFERVLCRTWNAFFGNGVWYASSGHARSILLHRFVLNIVDPSIVIDHKNRDGLDCRKVNLREATTRQNALNMRAKTSTGYRGVNLLPNGKYRARISTGINKRLHIGCFTDPVEAAKAHDEAAKRHYGEFAILNFGDVHV